MIKSQRLCEPDSMREVQYLRATIPFELAGQRLDQALARLFRDYSRTRLKEWIEEGKVLVDARRLKPRTLVAGGEQVELWAEIEPLEQWQPQALPLDLVFEDEELIIVNKPAGLVVHPGARNREGTLLNALLAHEPHLAYLPRAGIVHRLDKDTSGLMVVARTPRAYTHLVREIKARALKREYQAIINGVLIAGGTVEAPLGRHPVERTRMAVVEGGRPATTHYRVLRRFRAHTQAKIRLETGRTHQIRVHMAHLGHPLAGDPVYGRRPRIPPGATARLREALASFKRQALHAVHLSLLHPKGGKALEWTAPLPEDMVFLLECLEEDRQAAGT